MPKNNSRGRRGQRRLDAEARQHSRELRSDEEQAKLVADRGHEHSAEYKRLTNTRKEEV